MHVPSVTGASPVVQFSPWPYVSRDESNAAGVRQMMEAPQDLRGDTPPRTFAELVLRRAGDDFDGLLFEDRRWSWREVVAEARVRAEVFARVRGPGPFHIGVLLENVPEFVFVLLGAGLAGAAVVGINPTR